MKLTCGVAVLVAALLATAGGDAATAGSSRCDRAEGRTIVRNAVARVYGDDSDRSFPENPVYGCVRRTGRIRRVSSGGFGFGPTRFRLRSTVVGYARVVCSREGDCSSTVADVDLVSGRKRTVGPLYDVARVTDLALASGRRVAFIGEREGGVPRERLGVFVVFRNDAAGLTVLDEGSDVAPASLEVSGDRVRWHRGGAARSAALGAPFPR